MPRSWPLAALAPALLLLLASAEARIVELDVHGDGRSMFSVEKFGYGSSGRFELTLRGFEV
jgi:hypothetical protein